MQNLATIASGVGGVVGDKTRLRKNIFTATLALLKNILAHAGSLRKKLRRDQFPARKFFAGIRSRPEYSGQYKNAEVTISTAKEIWRVPLMPRVYDHQHFRY